MSQNPKSQARSAARLGAVQALYQQHMEGTKLARLLDEFHQHRLGRVIEDEEYADADTDFFDDIVGGVDARREEIDERLTARLAQGWTLARLDKTMLRFLFDGQRLKGDETPKMLEFEDGEQLDVMIEQEGGF